jgi:hypothetical protein
MSNSGNLNKFKFFFFKTAAELGGGNQNHLNASNASASSRKESDACFSQRTSTPVNYNSSYGRSSSGANTSKNSDFNLAYHPTQDHSSNANRFLSPSYSAYSLSANHASNTPTTGHKRSRKSQLNNDEYNEEASNRNRTSSTNERSMMGSGSSSRDVRHTRRHRSKVRRVTIDDPVDLNATLVECFLDKSQFYKSVCTVCARDKFKIDEFGKLCRVKCENKSLAKSASMPSISIHLSLSGASTSVSSRNRCYFTQAQLCLAQTFKSLDTDFDNKISFKEFYRGVVFLVTKLKNKSLGREGDENENDYESNSKLIYTLYYYFLNIGTQQSIF